MIVAPPRRSGVRSLDAARTAATTALRNAGITTCPALEVDVLLGQVTGYSRARLVACGEQTLGDAPAAAFDALVARRLTGEPIAYLVGTREFYGIDIRVTPETLIPRPDSETLIEVARGAYATTPPTRILDLGTGSGCLALALAKVFPTAHVWATDVSRKAVAVASANAGRTDHGRRVTVLAHAFGAPLPRAVATPVDLVVCNPPYLTESEWREAPRDVRAYEPRGALVGGADGLTHYPNVIRTATAALRRGGRLLLEIGAGQATAVRGLLSAPDWEPPRVHRDLAGRDRVVEARRSL